MEYFVDHTSGGGKKTIGIPVRSTHCSSSFRSIHNVRIERLWVDVTAQVGATWANLFTILELRHGLNINNSNHIWLLHFLFLPTINQDLTFFAESWNHHR